MNNQFYSITQFILFTVLSYYANPFFLTSMYMNIIWLVSFHYNINTQQMFLYNVVLYSNINTVTVNVPIAKIRL